jgi:50S ribosomal subunit-associated GTPase HflX
MDVTDNATLVGIRKWIDLAQGVTGKVPVHLVANKMDIEDKISTSQDDVMGTARELDATCSFASAKTGESVEDSFQALATAIVRSRLEKTMPMGARRWSRIWPASTDGKNSRCTGATLVITAISG